MFRIYSHTTRFAWRQYKNIYVYAENGRSKPQFDYIVMQRQSQKGTIIHSYKLSLLSETLQNNNHDNYNNNLNSNNET